MSPSGTDKPKPDVTYLVNVYDRKDDGKKPIRREIWYYNEADLKTLNTLRNAGQPKKVSLPSDLPKDFNWSGKMFDAPLSSLTTLRIGLIDKSDEMLPELCCKHPKNPEPKNPTVRNDPLPVGYAGWYANEKTPPHKLPPWGILIPVYKPLVNLPKIDQSAPDSQPFLVYRIAYYISTADRPHQHSDNIEALEIAQKQFLLSSDSDDEPPLSIVPDVDEHGDFINKESTASFNDMLDNFIPEDKDAQWTGTLWPDAPDP